MTDANDDDACEETALMTAIAAGDQAAFGDLITRYQRLVYNYFLRMGADCAIAEDFTQETFLRVYQHAGSYTRRAKLLTYIFTIARNCYIDQVRRAKKTEVELTDNLSAPTPSPLTLASRSELSAHLETAIRALSAPHRETFTLAVLEDLPQETVAEILQIPLGTVKSRVYYALQEIRETLNKLGYTHSE